MKFLTILLAVLVPPVGVLLTYGLSATLLINILLTLLGYLPGMIHGLWAVLKHYQKLNQEPAS
ncbi:YqaE/Pmp3 family membrane protein [filamentous cyanobacterium CCP5]|nr:YqaE/Pmp3 family membrane protein [filamentous cyanobacterium CCP5]